jgi:hypothetical protein
LAKGVESVAKSGKPPAPNPTVNPAKLKDMTVRLKSLQEDYDDAKIDIEANEDPAKEAELKKKLEEAKSAVDDIKQDLADSFKDYYAETSVQAAARNPTVWIPESNEPLDEAGRKERVKSTIERYDSYNPKDRRVAFDQLKKAADSSFERMKEIDSLLSGEKEGEEGDPYRTVPKKKVDRKALLEERESLAAKSDYFRADMQALTLHLVVDGDEEGAKMLSPVAGKMARALADSGYDINDLAEIGIGGDKIDIEKLTKGLNEMGSIELRGVMESTEDGKELLDRYKKIISSDRMSTEALNEVHEEMADLLFKQVQEGTTSSDDSDESNSTRKRKERPKELGRLDKLKSFFGKSKSDSAPSAPEYKAYVSKFKALIGDSIKKKKSSSARVADRYLKSVL